MSSTLTLALVQNVTKDNREQTEILTQFEGAFEEGYRCTDKYCEKLMSERTVQKETACFKCLVCGNKDERNLPLNRDDIPTCNETGDCDGDEMQRTDGVQRGTIAGLCCSSCTGTPVVQAPVAVCHERFCGEVLSPDKLREHLHENHVKHFAPKD